MLSPIKHCLVILLLSLPSISHSEAFYYLQQRFPDLAAPWTAADYAMTRKALTTIKQKHPDRLPRRGGEYTKAVFEKIIDNKNLEAQLNMHVAVEARREEAIKILLELRELMRLYFDFNATQQDYGTEALSLMIYSLRQQSIILNLTTEYWLTLAKIEQKNPERLQGLKAAKAAAGLLVNSALQYLEISSQFNAHELGLYANEITQHLPELYVHLLAADQVKILQKILELQQTSNSIEIIAALKDLHTVLTYLNHHK